MQCLKKALSSSLRPVDFLAGQLMAIISLNSKAHSLAKRARVCVDCLQSTFSLKICLVLIPASKIVNNDVTISEGIRAR